MKILVFNAGSSSLKFGIFNLDLKDLASRIFKGEFENFSNGSCTLHLSIDGKELQRIENISNVEQAIQYLPNLLHEANQTDFQAIGHRVAHGGELFHTATLIDTNVLAAIEKCVPLAPLHNPANIVGIKLSQKIWPNLPKVAVFDTAFHYSMPEYATTYAVPIQWRNLGLRRYGFHGTSHKYIALRVAKELNCKISDLKIISCHLGNGASVCAINYGKSIDTSMGMTPLEGLVMGTRSGDVDPGMFAYLQQQLGLSVAEIEEQLYKSSGLKAIAGYSDMREIEASNDLDSQLALDIYAYRVRKYIGAYAAAMDGVDVVVFTGGIGENSNTMRRRICDRLGFIGLYLDNNKNQNILLESSCAQEVQSKNSRVKVMVTKTCEQWMIAKETADLLQATTSLTIPVAVSARHAHLSKEALEILFGKDYQLTCLRKLNQPGSFAANETISLHGPKGSISKVRVLGPIRNTTQIEISKTDSYALGIDPPVRPSGKLENTPIIKISGPKSSIETDGVIIAARHIHMSPNDADLAGLKHGDQIDIVIGKPPRQVVFNNTLIRVNENFITEMHIDTDEANAAGIVADYSAELITNESKHNLHVTSRKSSLEKQ